MGAASKSRPTKRSSAASSSSASYPYASTISTVIFLALCVLGLWTLTSNTVRSPQTTNRSIDTASSLDSKQSGTEDSTSDRITRIGEEAEKQVFEDNPGQLPIDAIKADDNNKDAADTDKAKEKAPEEAAATVLGNEGVEEQVKEKYGEAQVSEKKGTKENQMDQQGESSNANSESGENKLLEKNLKPKDEGIDGEPERKEEQKEANPISNEDHKTETKENQTKEDQTDQQLKQVFPQEMKEKDQDQPVKHEQAQDAMQEKQQDQPLKQEPAQDAVQEKQQDQAVKQEPAQDAVQEKQPDQQPKLESLQDKVQEKQLNQPLKEESLQDTAHEKQPQIEDETKQQQQEQPRRKQQPANMTAESNAAGGSTLTTSVIPKESTESKKSWSTQAKQSENEKERNRMKLESVEESMYGYKWELCNVTTGADYIPCLDNEKAVKKLRSTKHFEHRERHCPEEPPTCLVPLPEGYKTPIPWPQSRDKIWYHNVPHTMLANFKGHQNWVKLSGEFLSFPGGGTQFIHGALHYISVMQEAVQNISWGKHTRVVLDVGCGVASFGGFLFEKDVLTMSFAPKDEHEAQVQFALERGIPAISAVMGSQRLPFPSRVFDLIHCARCRVPWHEEGGRLLLEVNRMLRPGGYFVWSATPVYRKGQEDRDIWLAMTSLTESMCWELVTIQRDEVDLVAAAFFRKPTSNECYEKRKDDNPPMCKNDNDPNAAWYIPLQPCMHKLPVEQNERGSQWPEDWPERLQKSPYWLSSSQLGIYGKPAPQDFERDYEHWKKVVSQLYMNGLGISWSNVRNVMDMRAVYGGFAAALKDVQIWVLNVVNINSPDTLPIIYERGLFGIYHDWCESFSTYPRTYDLLHADHLFSNLKTRCKLVPVMAEVDRIVRPGGKLIVRDESGTIGELENMLKSLHWEVNLTFSKDQEGILSAQKGNWRPSKYQNA